MATNTLLSSGVVAGADEFNYCSLRRGISAFSTRKGQRRSAVRVGKPNSNLRIFGACWTSGSVTAAARALTHDDQSSRHFSKTGRFLTETPGNVRELVQTPTIKTVSTDLKNLAAVPEDSIAGFLDVQFVPDVPLTSDALGVPAKIQSRPDWWPEAGTNYIDLDVHDLPHEAATLEWWYVNSHLSTKDGRQFSIFASFFRLGETEKRTGELQRPYHSVIWGFTNVSEKSYSYYTLLDPRTPQKSLQLCKSGEDGAADLLLRRALVEVYSKGAVPLPDRLLQKDAYVSTSRLELDYDGNRFEKTSDGRYHLTLLSQDGDLGAELTFEPKTSPIRHGEGGVVSSGPKDEGMFYYFMPNCKVEGKIIVDGKMERVQEASGWYDHEFGRPDSETTLRDGHAWNWLSAQLNNGYQISAYNLFDVNDTSVPTGQYVVIVDPAGTSRVYDDFVFQPVEDATWTSMRTFVEYPVAWELRVPGAKIDLRGEALDLPTQEFVTSLSKPAFWEGRINVSGVFLNGEWVSGVGYVERAGFGKMDTLKDFFKAVTKETLEAIHRLLPLSLTEEGLVRLIGKSSRPHSIAGVDYEQFSSSVIKPIRDVIDRSGKCWRSYGSIASMDVIGQMVDRSPDHLAYAELVHVGSLIIDDVQDQSSIRRGHPTCHKIHGEPLAINAGSLCYFLAQLMFFPSDWDIEDIDGKVRMYDMFFETMRAAHAGQALDIAGFGSMMPAVIEKGASAAKELETRVLTVHLLKSGVPCASVGRNGARKGGGSSEQVEAVGDFYEAIGVAFQIVDDVLNLRGFEGNLKQKGEDIACGKITMPIAKAMSRLPQESRQSLWDIIRSKPTDPAVIESAINQLEECGALQDCVDQAHDIVESAWRQLDPLVPDSFTKIHLRALGWYVLNKYY